MDTEVALELTAGERWLNIRRSWHSNLLRSIEVSGSLSLVLGFLLGCKLVAIVQVRDDVRVELLDALLEGRKGLDPIQIFWLAGVSF